jgi:tRNA-specific adenosine deaminase 2
MCAAALARIKIRRVIFGCHNDRFGGCGSLMHLHKSSVFGHNHRSHHGFPIVTGVLEQEAISLLRSFYDRENFHAPDDKRKRKNAVMAAISETEADVGKDEGRSSVEQTRNH